MSEKLYVVFRYNFTLLYLFFGFSICIFIVEMIDDRLSFLNSTDTFRMVFLISLLISSLFLNWVRKKYSEFLSDKKSIIKEKFGRKTNLFFSVTLWISIAFLIYWAGFRGLESNMDSIVLFFVSAISLILTVIFHNLKLNEIHNNKAFF